MTTADTESTTWHDDRFIVYLISLAQEPSPDRAALAALRRGLGREPGTAMEMYPYVAPWLAVGRPLSADWPYYVVAALFALHPVSWQDPGSNFGASLRILAEKSASSKSVERRVVALLNAQRDDLPHHLQRMIALLRAQDIPVNWRLLLRDIRYWDADNRNVKRTWARSFWAARATNDNDNQAEDTVSA